MEDTNIDRDKDLKKLKDEWYSLKGPELTDRLLAYFRKYKIGSDVNNNGLTGSQMFLGVSANVAKSSQKQTS